MEQRQLQILARAINQNGISKQLDMVVEECAELIQAINKVKRAGIVAYHITKPNLGMDLKTINTYNSLCAEVADVKIMVAQLELMLCRERIQLSMDRKLDRLETLLNKNK